MQVWIDAFDRAWEERTMFLLTMRPHITGHRSRIVALEGLIDHIQAKGGAWFATHEAAARYVREQAGRWAVLQVYAHNTVARTLYDHLGFQEVGGAVDMAAERVPVNWPAPGSIPHFHSFSPGECQESRRRRSERCPGLILTFPVQARRRISFCSSRMLPGQG